MRRPGKSLSAFLASLALGALPSGAQAQAQPSEPLVTDRPDFTESAVTVAPGRVQVELGYTFTRAGDADEHAIGEVLFRGGIVSWLEGRLGLNSFVVTDVPGAAGEGIEDLTLGFKALLFRPAPDAPAGVPEVALLLGADLPTGEDGLGADEVQPGVTAALAWELSDRVALASNVGWASLASDGERFGQGVASVALSHALDGSLSAYGEWFGLFPEVRDGDAGHYLNGGLAWLLSPDLQLDWRIGIGLQDPGPNWFTGAGLSLRL